MFFGLVEILILDVALIVLIILAAWWITIRIWRKIWVKKIKTRMMELQKRDEKYNDEKRGGK